MRARAAFRLAAAILVSLATPAALAADVTKPGAVGGLLVGKSGNDAVLTWSAVTTDVTGAAETVTQYRVYAGSTPSFVPDKVGGTNRIGTSATTSFTVTNA